MSAVVFIGPTLSTSDARAVLEASYLPPVAQGDVVEAALVPGTRAIGIVDGYFERTPSVWHKEILWAMARGVHVFGSASMGALRAAELHPFGMEGVGTIYRAFATGELEDDDEVAVAHGPEEHGFLGTSEALVNVRATLAAAMAAGVIGAGTHRRVVDSAKAMFYPDRVYPRILDTARAGGADTAEIEALARFVVTGRVDAKRDDALDMLRTMRRRLDEGLEPKKVTYTFQCNRSFHRVLEAAGVGG